jgi:hypothetical protein
MTTNQLIEMFAAVIDGKPIPPMPKEKPSRKPRKS